MTVSLFPLGWEHYLAGGLLIGAGVSLLSYWLDGSVAWARFSALHGHRYRTDPFSSNLASSIPVHGRSSSLSGWSWARPYGGNGWGLCGVCP